MNLKYTTRNILLIVALSAALTGVVLVMIFTVNQITPFGTHNLLVGDMSAQYVPFLTGFRNALLTGHFSLFSFSLGVGENIFPLITYYLLSPFNLLVLLFPTSQLPVAISWIFILKDMTIAATTCWFLARHFNRIHLLLPFFALAFSLCGFASANFVNIMWLDGLIYLPLICDGIDQIKAGKQSISLFVWLTAAIVSNYYIGYMLGLFTLIYAVETIIRTNDLHFSLITAISHNRQFITRFIFTEAASVMSSMVVLLPTMLGMLQTAKTSPSTTNSLAAAAKPQFGLEIFSQLGLGGQTYDNRLLHAPAIFSSLAIALLVIGYFFHPQIPRNHKLAVSVTAGILSLSMLIGPINLVWHMLNEPSGSPFRYSFLLSFVLISAAYEMLLATPQRLSFKAKLRTPTILAGLLIVGYLDIRLGRHVLTNEYLAVQPNSLNVLIVNLLLTVIFSYLLFTAVHPMQQLLIGTIVCLEMGTNFGYTLKSEPLPLQTSYETAYPRVDTIVSKTKTTDNQLYRIDQSHSQLAPIFKETYLGYNDPILFNYNGIQEYSSTLTESTRQSLKMIGLFSKNQRRISTAGSTAISDMLLGVKYQLNPAGKIEKNTSFAGIGFPVTNQFAHLQLTAGTLFTNLERILQRLTPSDQPYLVSESGTNPQRQTIRAREKYTLTIIPKLSGPLYFDTSDKLLDYSAIYVNHTRLKTIPNQLDKQYLVKLGTAKRGVPVTLQLTSKSQNTLHDSHFNSLNESQFSKVDQHLKQSAFTPTYTNDRLVGTAVRPNSQSEWLYTAIPYDPGWTATVNGQPVEPIKVLGNFTALPLTDQSNHIVMSYHVPGLLLGIILSLLGLLAFSWRQFRNLALRKDVSQQAPGDGTPSNGETY